MIYPTLYFNYNNSGYAVIIIVDTDLPKKGASLFGITLEDDRKTIALFMNLFSTFIAQAEIFSMKKVGMMDLTMGFYQSSMMTMKKIGERNKPLP